MGYYDEDGKSISSIINPHHILNLVQVTTTPSVMVSTVWLTVSSMDVLITTIMRGKRLTLP
jgi:hypothetical protein